MIPTACLSRVKQYEAAKDRYFHLAASSVPLPFALPVVPFLFSPSFYPPVGIRGPPSEGCKECPIPPACRALSSRGLLRTGTFISLRLLSHFLSCFLSSYPFRFSLPYLLLSQLVGALFCREVRPVRGERGILVVEVDQSAGCHPPTHLFDPCLLPRREDSAARTVQPASPVSSDERGKGQF